MGKRVVDETSLTLVADAIRAKAEKTDLIEFPGGFVDTVNGIEDQLVKMFNNELVHYVNTVNTSMNKEYTFTTYRSLETVYASKATTFGYGFSKIVRICTR